jgi:aspartate ammonia-lyase
MRTEQDFIGKETLPKNALYGIQSVRAKANFPMEYPFHLEWYKAMGIVKLAMYETIEQFQVDATAKYGKLEKLQFIPETIINALKHAADEVSEGKHFDYFIVPAVQGGAGTSINMNVNEIIANRSLQILSDSPGNYHRIHPIEHANRYQSTNDVVPTALRVASLRLLEILEEKINALRSQIEIHEQQNRDSLRIAYTQMQEAVPSSYGKLFSTYNDALSRDWWRVSKCFERIKVVNLGGAATGTGITVPRYVIMEAVRNLHKLTGLPITRGENLSDATSNLDSWVEIHAILKAHAVNLEKISSDLRLMAADLFRNKSLKIPQKQIGSSIMPGKINPVIPEYIISIAHKVYANDQIVSSLSAMGTLELNPYLPQIGDAVLDSLKLLISANESMNIHLIQGMEIEIDNSYQKLINSPVISTALIPLIGYTKATELSHKMKSENMDIFQANFALNYLEENTLKDFLSAENLLKLGFTIRDVL